MAVVVGLGLHVLLPALAGLERSVEVVRSADLRWIAAAGICSMLSLALYVAVFALVVAHDLDGVGWRGSYQIAMASQAASTVVTAGGAGGIALVYWALARHGMQRPRAAARIVAFLAFHYAVYLGALVLFGVGLGLGLLPGAGPASLTLLPAAVAALLLGVAWLAATRPATVE